LDIPALDGEDGNIKLSFENGVLKSAAKTDTLIVSGASHVARGSID